MRRWFIGGSVALILLPLVSVAVFLFWPSPVEFVDVSGSDASDCFAISASQSPRDVWQRIHLELRVKVGGARCVVDGSEVLGECLASIELDSDVGAQIEEKLSIAEEMLTSSRQAHSMQHILAAAELAVTNNEERAAYQLFDAYFENLENISCASDDPSCYEEATILAKLLFSLGHYHDARSLLEFALSQRLRGTWTVAKVLDQYYLLELEKNNQLEAAGLLFRAAKQYQAEGDTRTAADRYAVFAFRVLQVGAAIPKEQRDCIENARKISLLRSDALYTSLIPESSIVDTFDILTLRAGVRRAQSW